MQAVIIRRLLVLVPVLLIGSVLVWSIIYLLPGDPAVVLGGDFVTAAQLEAIRQQLGLDQSIPQQYLIWLHNALSGDLGYSYISGTPVADLLVARLPATVQLTGLAMILTVGIGLPVGTASALRAHSALGWAATAYQNLGLSIPTFWFGLILILLFGVNLGIFPVASQFVPFWQDPIGALRNTLLPATALAFYASSVLSRFVSSSLKEAMRRDFVRLARAKGVPEHQVVIRHGLRNALLPVVTVVGLQLGTFLGGALVTEAVFTYPGLGRLLYTAVGQRDYAVIQGTLLLIMVMFLVINLVVDLVYAKLDPRFTAN